MKIPLFILIIESLFFSILGAEGLYWMKEKATSIKQLLYGIFMLIAGLLCMVLTVIGIVFIISTKNGMELSKINKSDTIKYIPVTEQLYKLK